jgi:glycosyltransferase involved in cell wall biosynthesis
MQVSVVIATYNRARLLEGALEALAAQDTPPSLEWEIVVVDNNSTDRTPHAVAAFSKTTAIPVRYVFEREQGLSRARNRGIRETHGSIVAFSDDDVLPAPDWVAGIAAAIDRWNADGVGGRILPRWEMPPPRWLSESRRPLRLLAIMDFEGSQVLSLPLRRQPQVWGANMAFRRELFARVGEFDPRRGIVGTTLYRGEESDLIHRAMELGLTIAYDAALTVFHRIGPERMQKAYFRRLTFESARGEALVTPLPDGGSLLGAPLASYRRALGDSCKWVGVLLFRRREAFDRQLRWLESVGELTGYWRTRRLNRAATRADPTPLPR